MSTELVEDQVEVTIIGPGYGESVVVHLGNDEWLVVDSCWDREKSRPAPLVYLDEAGISPDRVAMVVASHWHDDHVKGLATILRECGNAEFVASQALQSGEFLRLVKSGDAMSTVFSSGLSEFESILDELDRTSREFRFASADRPLWSRDNGGPIASVVALSPSDTSIRRALADIASLLPEELKPKTRVPSTTPNRAAVVLWVVIGGIAVLLGADLEEEGDQHTGWSAILASATRPEGLASAFKVPHHGSENAHHDGVWESMLEVSPVPVVCPFTRGRVVLPRDKDKRRMCGLIPTAYLTAPTTKPGKRVRGRVVEKMIRESTMLIRDMEGPLGRVRLRRRPSDADWEVDLFGAAQEMCSQGARAGGPTADTARTGGVD